MEQTRRALQMAQALFESLQSPWSLYECEPDAKKLLAAARRHPSNDEDTVRANLLAALIQSLEEELQIAERELATDLKQKEHERTLDGR